MKLIAPGFGLFMYGGFLGIALYDDPGALVALPAAGLALITLILIVYAILHRD